MLRNTQSAKLINDERILRSTGPFFSILKQDIYITGGTANPEEIYSITRRENVSHGPAPRPERNSTEEVNNG